MITVFTPTFNRAYCLSSLYKSLCKQANKNFEWLIVDDGSTDNTQELVASFISEKKIDIVYFKQSNGGKHLAINKGVELSKTDLFFIVDSDDTLTIDATEFLQQEFEKIKDDQSFAGISGIRIDKAGNRIGGNVNFDVVSANFLDFRYKMKIKGDMAEAYKTKVLQQYPFPTIEDEKFCPESFVWNQISQDYKLRIFNKGIYICEYLQDGLTAKITKIRMQSPITSMMYYSQFFKMKIPFHQTVKAAINFWRFSFNSSKSINFKIKLIGIKTLIVFPISFLMFLNDSKK
jgi:glycosyltransferase involved in cell wall biosynthesis